MVSLFNSLIGWVFRISTIKFVVFGALGLLLGPLMTLLLSLISSTGLEGIPSLVGALPSDFLFYLALFRFDIGLPILVAAALTRFFIRRLPVVG